ncbi:hypothetical protein [Niabella hibiscisoli]|nr:hypothetical protein [Niabella hibiscisoli]
MKKWMFLAASVIAGSQFVVAQQWAPVDKSPLTRSTFPWTTHRLK